MSSKTRIIVLHMKEVVYTIAFLILAILLGVLIYFMFGPGRSQTTSGKADSLYTPGVYRSSITLNQNTFDVQALSRTRFTALPAVLLRTPMIKRPF